MKSCLGLLFVFIISVALVIGGVLLYYLSATSEVARGIKTNEPINASVTPTPAPAKATPPSHSSTTPPANTPKPVTPRATQTLPSNR